MVHSNCTSCLSAFYSISPLPSVSLLEFTVWTKSSPPHAHYLTKLAHSVADAMHKVSECVCVSMYHLWCSAISLTCHLILSYRTPHPHPSPSDLSPSSHASPRVLSSNPFTSHLSHSSLQHPISWPVAFTFHLWILVFHLSHPRSDTSHLFSSRFPLNLGFLTYFPISHLTLIPTPSPYNSGSIAHTCMVWPLSFPFPK